jgi:CDP-diacylglycerol--glycerol-3-phosphate 3-phosphatidyltransferase
MKGLAMKFFVNFLSVFRIIASFAIPPMFLSQMYWTTFALFVAASISDFIDGYLAKKYNAATKLGGVLDHMGDKFLIVNGLITLMIFATLVLTVFYEIFPFWYIWLLAVPSVLMICRDLYVSGLREFLGSQKIELPVPNRRFAMGKIKLFIQAFSMCVLFFWVGLWSAGAELADINIILVSGVSGLWLSMVASIWSAVEYTAEFWKKLKKIK